MEKKQLLCIWNTSYDTWRWRWGWGRWEETRSSWRLEDLKILDGILFRLRLWLLYFVSLIFFTWVGAFDRGLVLDKDLPSADKLYCVLLFHRLSTRVVHNNKTQTNSRAFKFLQIRKIKRCARALGNSCPTSWGWPQSSQLLQHSSVIAQYTFCHHSSIAQSTNCHGYNMLRKQHYCSWVQFIAVYLLGWMSY